MAVSLTTDGKNKIYVLDSEANEVIKFDESLKEMKRTGRKGWNNGEVDFPTYMDGSSGLEIFICDGRNFRIQRFDLNLGFISSIYTNTESFPFNLQYQTPKASIFINSNLYVIDGENNRIVVYQSNGVPYFSFGGFQSANNPLVNPIKIVKDSENNIYILDKGKNSIDKYDNFGNFINSFSLDNIKSVTINNNIIFILLNSEILIYDSKRNSFSGKIMVPVELLNKDISDFLAVSGSNFLFITSKSLLNYKLK